MEAFSDGVFSIAATLLVLDIALRPPGTPLEQVLHAWPAYLGYVISCSTCGRAVARVATSHRRISKSIGPIQALASDHQ